MGRLVSSGRGVGSEEGWGGGAVGRLCFGFSYSDFVVYISLRQCLCGKNLYLHSPSSIHVKKTAMCRKSLELLQKGGESELRADFLQSQDIGHIKCCGLQGGPHGLLLSASFSLSLCAGSEHVSTMPLFLKNN